VRLTHGNKTLLTYLLTYLKLGQPITVLDVLYTLYKMTKITWPYRLTHVAHCIEMAIVFLSVLFYYCCLFAVTGWRIKGSLMHRMRDAWRLTQREERSGRLSVVIKWIRRQIHRLYHVTWWRHHSDMECWTEYCANAAERIDWSIIWLKINHFHWPNILKFCNSMVMFPNRHFITPVYLLCVKYFNYSNLYIMLLFVCWFTDVRQI